MRTTPHITLFSTLFLIASGVASASNDKVSDPAAAAPRLGYQSAFADYTPAHDVPLQSWQSANAEAASGSGHAGHNMGGSGAMAAQPEPKPAASAPTSATADAIRARGVVQQIDKRNSKVKLSHEPIEQLGWPKMTMFMRLKNADLADQVKVGDSVEFELEKAGSGYVISSFSNSASGSAAPAAKAVEESQTAPAKASSAEKPPTPVAKTAAPVKPAASSNGIQAKGKIIQIDKANSKVKITHEPIAEIGWPKMTMFFRVKDSALLDQAKEGAEQQFTLEKSGSGYVISGFGK